MRTLSERAERIRIKILEVKNRAKMKPCMDCGIQYNPWVMDFDHRDPSTKKGSVSKIKNSMSSVLAEIEKCDVVCSNCHRERTQKQILAKKTKKETL